MGGAIMLIPYDLTNKMKVSKLNSNIQVTRYVENAPSKIQTKLQENLLVIVRKGRKKISCGDYTTEISSGEFGFFKKGNYIMNQILSNDAYESLLVFITDDYLMDIRNMYQNKVLYSNEKKSIPYIQGYIGEDMQYEVKQILKLLKFEEHNYEEILKLKIKELLLYLMSGTTGGQLVKFIQNDEREADHLRCYMEKNYENCKDIKSIATDLNMSASTFKRKFVQIYDETPGKWINNKRLEKATLLIRTTDYLMADICFLCGFESVSTFNVQFKKKFGMAPSEFAKSI
jgi:AraC-like DNA-binding protein